MNGMSLFPFLITVSVYIQGLEAWGEKTAYRASIIRKIECLIKSSRQNVAGLHIIMLDECNLIEILSFPDLGFLEAEVLN